MDHVDDPATPELCALEAAHIVWPFDLGLQYPEQDAGVHGLRSATAAAAHRSGTVTGRDGITIFGTGNSEAAQQAAAAASGSGGIGVNAYLWRGALETINFMPLASADPFGGLIITDWYQPAGLTDERLKVHVLILDRSLRADGVQVSVFRQLRDARRLGRRAGRHQDGERA